MEELQGEIWSKGLAASRYGKRQITMTGRTSKNKNERISCDMKIKWKNVIWRDRVRLLRLIWIVKNVLHKSKKKFQRLASITIRTISVIIIKVEKRNKNNAIKIQSTTVAPRNYSYSFPLTTLLYHWFCTAIIKKILIHLLVIRIKSLLFSLTSSMFE